FYAVAHAGERVAGEREVVDPVRHRVIDAAADLVDAAVLRLDDGVARVVDEVEIVARAADHAVGAEGSVDGVVAAEAVDRVVPRGADQRVVAFRAVNRGRGGGRRAVHDDEVLCPYKARLRRVTAFGKQPHEEL